MRRLISQQTSISVPAFANDWVRGSLRDHAPVILAVCAAASIGTVIVAAATSAAMANRMDIAEEKIHQAVVSTTGAIGIRLSQVSVIGRTHTRAEDILAAIDMRQGDPLLAINPADVRDRLETLPWVKTASVERLLPGEIRVTLTERMPIALWQTRNGAFHLVDADGVVIDASVDQFLSLPVVVGRGAPQAASDLLAMLNTQPQLASRVTAAVRFGERRWDLWFDGYAPQQPREEDAAKGKASAEKSGKGAKSKGATANTDDVAAQGIQVRLPEFDADKALARLARLESDKGILERDISMLDLRQDDRLIVHRLHPDDDRDSAKPARSKPSLSLPLRGPSQDA